jgi:hypothetical protein
MSARRSRVVVEILRLQRESLGDCTVRIDRLLLEPFGLDVAVTGDCRVEFLDDRPAGSIRVLVFDDDRASLSVDNLLHDDVLKLEPWAVVQYGHPDIPGQYVATVKYIAECSDPGVLYSDCRYKRRTAVCQMLPVTQNDGRCRIFTVKPQ